MPPLKPCLTCNRLSTEPRCELHRSHRAARRPDLYASKTERARRAAAVAAWRALNGDVCPGWRRPPHPSVDLTADHLIEVHAGGAMGGTLVVLCRACNSAKSNAA